MNNKTITWVVLAVAVIGGAWYLSSGSNGGVGAPPVATTTAPTSTSTSKATAPAKSGTVKKTVTAPAKIAGVSTLSYLFGLKQSLVCTVKTSGSLSHSGTMYIADAKMRANFTTSSMIDDGESLYVWMNGASKGLQLSAASSASGSAATFNGGFDPSTDITFSCGAWAKDASVFVPPSSVSFSNTL